MNFNFSAAKRIFVFNPLVKNDYWYIFNCSQDYDDIQNEAKMLGEMDHEHIIRYYYSLKIRNNEAFRLD